MRRFLPVLLLAACVPDRASFVLPLSVSALPEEVFVGEVRLTDLTVDIGLTAARFEAPADPSTVVLLQVLGGTTALAHPGHGLAGAVLGEAVFDGAVTEEGAAHLGDVAFYEGRYATGRLALGEATWSGIAHTPMGPLPFALETPPPGEVLDIPFAHDLALDDAASTIVLGLDPSSALSWVVFEDTDGDGHITSADAENLSTFPFGLTATPTWTLEIR